MQANTNWGQFIPLISVFFFWGFVASSNDILIPVFKNEFNLSQTQSLFVVFAFYIAYTIGSLIYMGISKLLKKDLIHILGYKNSLILGLSISALGALIFYPAANFRSIELMLTALFVVGLGFSLQQTVANPLSVLMGSPKTGSQRLTMAGGINNFGTTIAPILVAYAIFGSINAEDQAARIENVKIPYLIIGAAFILVAVILKFSKLPDQKETEHKEEANTTRHTLARNSPLSYPQLLLGMIAIFVYVGVEVSTVANLPEFLHQELNFTTKQAAPYVALYWASMMIGRWGGAVEALGLADRTTKILKFIAPYIAFAVFLIVTAISGHNWQQFLLYAIIIVLLIIADLLSKGDPARMLMIYSGAGILALFIGMVSTGMVSAYAIIAVGLFCSTLWPCIFTLAIAGLGKHTNQGSSFLIMMIMGGAWISLLQGFVADHHSIQVSYIVGVLCFAYLIYYAIQVRRTLQKQGVNYLAD
ncbi:MAG: sugar MFS transporter [Weeksellaceae bacterium]|nr:sugar MFS transporter [Weeksellaceae bacterium]